MNRIIIIISLLVITQLGVSQNSSVIKWHSLQQALDLNKENPKLIFIDVYTDWCGWCKKMDADTFSKPYIAAYMNEKYYCVKLDAEGTDTVTYMGRTFTNTNPNGRRSTNQIAAVLLQNKMSYPSYVFMNEKNQVLTVVKGYIEATKFDPIIHWFGEDAYKSQSYQEYASGFKKTAP